MDFSQLLIRAGQGDRAARDQLIGVAYDDLRALAGAQMRDQPPHHTLTATALVHEVSAKLLEKSGAPRGLNRGQFFAYVATAMRRTLVDHARAKAQQKRGGGRSPLQLDEAMVAAEQQPEALVQLHEALDRFAEFDPRRCKVVEMRYFGGMSICETAEALGLSPATVKRDWEVARLWLLRELQQGEADVG